MRKVWFCPTCGYEVDTRGRCHSCRQRLVASPLPELEPGDEEDEVGYRLGDWLGEDRGRLIVNLIEAGVAHRFEDDELVVAAEDEARVDDLVAEVQATAGVDEGEGWATEDEEAPGRAAVEDPPALRAAVSLLSSAAGRLRQDPTDMHADAEVAEASSTVFAADGLADLDEEDWAAVGRVTRRLLAALGAEEALEEEIRLQAAVLEKLLQPAVAHLQEAATPPFVGFGPRPGGEGGEVTGRDGAAESAGGDDEGGDEAAGDAVAEEAGAAAADRAGEAPEEGEVPEEGEESTVYELPQWLPEQRAQLSVLLDDADVPHSWDGPDLVVPVAREADAEALFADVEGLPDLEEDDEARYRSLEELFAAADRLAGAPDDEERATAAMVAARGIEGPTPVGFDDASWFQIVSRARALADAIEHDAPVGLLLDEATTLRDLLRALV